MGFTVGDNTFSLKYPNNLTINEALLVQERFRLIDELIEKRDPSVLEYIDMDSFATRYIVEELMFNFDAGLTSWYYYYRSKDPRLYAGSGWDYDGAFGEANDEFQDYTKRYVDVEEFHGICEMLRWDEKLFDIPEYREYLVNKYKQLRPLFVDLYTDDSDRYFDQVRNSVDMDAIRWSESEYRVESGQYRKYSSTEKYFKFFCIKGLALWMRCSLAIEKGFPSLRRTEADISSLFILKTEG